MPESARGYTGRHTRAWEDTQEDTQEDTWEDTQEDTREDTPEDKPMLSVDILA